MKNTHELFAQDSKMTTELTQQQQELDNLQNQEQVKQEELRLINERKAQLINSLRPKWVADTKAFIRMHGLTAKELFGSVPSVQNKAGAPAAEGKRKPAKDIFKDPATGQAWSGRGIISDWLKKRIDAGAKASDFLVPGIKWDGKKTRIPYTKELRTPQWVRMLIEEGWTEKQVRAGQRD